MPKKAINHLHSAKSIVSQRIGAITIQGRELFPDEEKELDSLYGANNHIDSAIDNLTTDNSPPILVIDPPTTVSIPENGRYTVANDALQIQLRIDLEVCNIISGDMFAIFEPKHYIASFRTNPGSQLNSQSNPAPIVIEDHKGHRAKGQLSFTEFNEAQITVVLTIDSQITSLPINKSVTFVGRMAGKSIRELGIELDHETDVETQIQWDMPDRTVAIETCLGDAGFDVFNVGERSLIPNPNTGSWDDAQLHGLMKRYAEEPLNRKAWNIHVLMLKYSRLAGLLGIMFDSGKNDRNNLPRQGVAIFQDEIKFPIIDMAGNRSTKPRTDWKRKVIQTTVHEIGHALNLAHRFERPVGHADSLSFMNYDWRYLGGGNRDKFWREFNFSFDQDELDFLRHAPWQKIVPGGAEFHTVPYWENTGGGYSPYYNEHMNNELSLRLIPPISGNFFQFGQPVLLTVEMTNHTDQVFVVPKHFLDPKGGFMSLEVKRQTVGNNSQEAMTFNPVVHRCYDLAKSMDRRVSPGETISDNVNLTFGSAGFTFIEPGNYDVTAILTLPIDQDNASVVASPPLVIRMGYPKTTSEEQDGLNLFRTDVGYFLALGGSDILRDAEQELDQIVARRQHKKTTVTDPLVANILRCKAINLSRDFVQYDQGAYSVRPANHQESNNLFNSIKKISANIFDPHTSTTTDKLAKEIYRTIKS
jgi:hypothetical protein